MLGMDFEKQLNALYAQVSKIYPNRLHRSAQLPVKHFQQSTEWERCENGYVSTNCSNAQNQ